MNPDQREGHTTDVPVGRDRAEPPRKLIIHAGMHKTGSTAIQHWLRHAKRPDFHYFKWRNPNHSDLFVLLFEENPQTYFAYARAGYTRERALKERAEQMARMRREIEGARKDVFIFSAERVSTAPDAAVLAMHDFFAAYFTDIQVYAYVRKPSGFMTSMFQQHLKTGRIQLSFAELWPGYRRRLARLFKIFGRENVRLRSYDQLVASGTETVGDFARWIGLRAIPPSNIVLNWSMSATGMALLCFYRKYIEPDLSGRERARYDRHVLYTAQTIAGEAFHVALECESGQRDFVAKDLEWISQWMGPDFDDLGAPSDGVRTFSNEEDILRYAVGMSHRLMPWKKLTPLDPDAPGSFDATKARFFGFLSAPLRLRVGIGRGVNWATGRNKRVRG